MMNIFVNYLKFIGNYIQSHPLIHYLLAGIFVMLIISLIIDFSKKKEVPHLEKIQKKYIQLNNDMLDIAGDDVYATHLDLAKAYMEMGHKDAAKNLLKEASQEGNLKQKKEANYLLETI